MDHNIIPYEIDEDLEKYFEVSKHDFFSEKKVKVVNLKKSRREKEKETRIEIMKNFDATDKNKKQALENRLDILKKKQLYG